MIFSSKVSKFGKGKNVSAYMPSNNSIRIYSYNSGMTLKNVSINNDGYSMTKSACNMPYNAVIEIDNNAFITRLNKSIGLQVNE